MTELMTKTLCLSLKGLVKRKRKGSILNYNSKVLNYAYEAVLMIRNWLNITLLRKKLFSGPILSVSEMKNN